MSFKKKLIELLGGKEMASATMKVKMAPEADNVQSIGRIRPGQMATIGTEGVDTQAARRKANRIIDLMRKDGIAPVDETIVALLMIVTEHAEGVHVETIPADVAERLESQVGPSTMAMVGKMNKSEKPLPTTDASGNPLFMAAPPKRIQ